jgi:hypothetical protein
LKVLLSIITSLSIALVAAPSSAQDREPDVPPPREPLSEVLRAPGSTVLDDVVGSSLGALSVTLGWFTVQSSTQESDGMKTSATLLRFRPSADVFIVRGLSVGGSIGIERTTQTAEGVADGSTLVGSSVVGSGTRTTSGRNIAPRVGYAFRLTDDLVLWPRVGFGYGTSETTQSQGSTPIVIPAGDVEHGETWSIGADASLLYLLGRHAALAVGPQIQYVHAKVDEPRSIATSFDVGVRGTLRLMF